MHSLHKIMHVISGPLIIFSMLAFKYVNILIYGGMYVLMSTVQLVRHGGRNLRTLYLQGTQKIQNLVDTFHRSMFFFFVSFNLFHRFLQ